MTSNTSLVFWWLCFLTVCLFYAPVISYSPMDSEYMLYFCNFRNSCCYIIIEQENIAITLLNNLESSLQLGLFLVSLSLSHINRHISPTKVDPFSCMLHWDGGWQLVLCVSDSDVTFASSPCLYNFWFLSFNFSSIQQLFFWSCACLTSLLVFIITMSHWNPSDRCYSFVASWRLLLQNLMTDPGAIFCAAITGSPATDVARCRPSVDAFTNIASFAKTN